MSRPIPIKLVEDGAMYASEAKIHPREIDGRLQRLRTIAVFWLLGMFYLFPWLNWGQRQMVLFDLPARKFYVFGLSFWPQDFFYLSMLLMIAAFALFFFTALAGRLWCGYACPQTVWTEVFLWMERWTEGKRPQRIKLDAGPWTREKILRKSAKQVLWVTFALWTGFTFVGFFTPIRELGAAVADFTLGGWELFWIFFYGFATYGNAGYMREQVCKYMCPYARFQGAMFDRNTLIIAYDEGRGEARGARRKGTPSVLERSGSSESCDATQSLRARTDARAGVSPQPQIVQSLPSLGDCIDCTICVQVCPTGIDIRNGLQYECIACGACIDACDSVMDKMNYPRGLIRYSTLNAIEGKPSRVLRPRIVIYAAILLALIAMFAWSVSSRVPLIVDVLRDRNALYRTAAEGSIENTYTIKLLNKDQRLHRYRISIRSAVPLQRVAGDEFVDVAAEQVVELPISLSAPAASVHGLQNITFVVESLTDADVRYEETTRFFGPG